MRKRGRMTIVDIASLSGVSKSTVSRVLSGAGNVSPEARERVDAAVRSSGFQRNDLARSLRSGRSGMVGLVIPDIANPFWADVARGAQDAAAERGTSVLIFNSDWDAARERGHLNALMKARVDGAIVNPVRDGADEIGHFDVPLVLIGSSAERFSQLSSVGSDIAQGVRLGLERLARAGMGPPALILGEAARTARTRFLAAVAQGCHDLGWSVETLVTEDAAYTVQGGREAMRRLLQRRRPRAVFAANDLMALGALQAVREAGLGCPGDVAVLGFDGIPAAEVSAPTLTTVAKPARDIGQRAFALLAAQIDGDKTVSHDTLPCSLCERESLPSVGRLAAVRTG